MLTPLRSIIIAGLLLLAVTLSASGDARYDPAYRPAPAERALNGQAISVMTYNVNALPWPVALGREAALEAIANRLAAMRRAGHQPHIILIQEAFSAEAEQIASRAGYAHLTFGPDTGLRSAVKPVAGDLGFVEQARWNRGERSGKRLGSGLMILSDHPIVQTERMAFPDFACAGFDCLANKGVLLAWIEVPGMSKPLAVANTHLNARKAAGVPIARSQTAYGRQAALMAAFIGSRVPDDTPLIVGGDMNIGFDDDRARAFFDAFARSGLEFVAPRQGGLRRALSELTSIDGRTRRDLAIADGHGKDWLFARARPGVAMPIRSARVPFGSEPDDAPLSDHIGYIIDYAPPSAAEAQAALPALPQG